MERRIWVIRLEEEMDGMSLLLPNHHILPPQSRSGSVQQCKVVFILFVVVILNVFSVSYISEYTVFTIMLDTELLSKDWDDDIMVVRGVISRERVWEAF